MLLLYHGKSTLYRNPGQKFHYIDSNKNLGQRFGASKMHLSPPPPTHTHSDLDYCRFLGGYSVVGSLFYVSPSVCGSCVCSLFCYALLSVLSSFAITLTRKGELVFCFVFPMPYVR